MINKINLFINYANIKTCDVDYCCYSIHEYDDIPDIFSLNIDTKIYLIEHSNNNDGRNKINFILLNVPFE